MEKSHLYQFTLKHLAAYCSKAERCSYDIRRKLSVTELSEEEQAEILQRLRAEKFVDDLRYAISFCRDKYRFNGWGQIKIVHALRAKQISSETVQEALSQLQSQLVDRGESSVEHLYGLMRRKYESISATTPTNKLFAKLIRWAMSRGFGYEEAKQAYSKLNIGEVPDE